MASALALEVALEKSLASMPVKRSPLLEALLLYISMSTALPSVLAKLEYIVSSPWRLVVPPLEIAVLVVGG